MLVVGLTGSIGMGKSTVAARLRARGIAVCDADAEVHKLFRQYGSPRLTLADFGYLLARQAETISVGEVLRYIEGSKATKGERKGIALAEFWGRVDGAMALVVDKTSFAELAREFKEKQSKYVPNWEI